MAMTVSSLRHGLAKVAAQMEAAADELNTLDGQLGDGDLGVTMVRGGRAVAELLPGLPDDLGQAFLACAQAFTKLSGSSYGTLVATALMSAAKATKGRAEVPWTEVSALLAGARDAMMARGKANLGQKTVLDPLDAAAKVTAGLDDPAAILAAARRAVAETMDAFRGQPAQIGRARIFGDRSIGLDDPGMLAFRRVLDGLAG